MPDRLAEIRARLDAATVTGWYDQTSVQALTPWSGVVAEMVAHAPADIAWLLAEVERWRADDAENRDTIGGEIERANKFLDEAERARAWARAWRNHAWVQRAMWQDLEGVPRGQGTPPEVHRHLARREFRIIGRRWRRRAAERSMWYYLRGERLGPRP